MSDVVKSWCNTCFGDTAHDVIFNETLESNPDAHVDKRLAFVRCRGCGEPSIRRETWYFDPTPDESNQGGTIAELARDPPRRWRRPPEWLDQLEQLDSNLKGILDELYSAANDSQVMLLAVGVRTALDHTMTRILGDIGGFEAKLKAMVARGLLTERQRDTIEVVVDAGSAAAHRGYKPQREVLVEMMTIMEGVIHDHYLAGPMLAHMKTVIPPRPQRQSRATPPGTSQPKVQAKP